MKNKPKIYLKKSVAFHNAKIKSINKELNGRLLKTSCLEVVSTFGKYINRSIGSNNITVYRINSGLMVNPPWGLDEHIALRCGVDVNFVRGLPSEYDDEYKRLVK